jgi:hypothetical protein
MTDAVERRMLAEASKTLLDEKPFQAAVIALRKGWFDELLVALPTSAQERDLITRLRLLDDFTQKLASFVDNERMAHKGRG